MAGFDNELSKFTQILQSKSDSSIQQRLQFVNGGQHYGNNEQQNHHFADTTASYIPQLLYMDYIPRSLKDFFSDPKVTFVGAGRDVAKLRAEYGLSCCSISDVREGSVRNHYEFWLKNGGALNIASTFIKEYASLTRVGNDRQLPSAVLGHDDKGKPLKFRDTFISRRGPRLILPSRTSYSIEAKGSGLLGSVDCLRFG
ncbi:hypothetical protein NC651_032245 [Populus alba x Populus x berolinensis]|nr:hypothetical protein NC651_032245 [Populus alba x Populus x berolinensis]